MIRRSLLALLRYLRLMGLDPIKSLLFLRGLPRFAADYFRIRRDVSKGEGEFALGTLYPCLQDRYQSSGMAKGHYFHQDLLVAQRIYEKNPERLTREVEGLKSEFPLVIIDEIVLLFI